jgi:hypothetical protein
VAIAVTAPDFPPHHGTHEVETLYLDMIARARRYIYIENQYFTSHSIGDALEQRLREPGGPEIVVVTRLLSHGWLEEHTMGVLRSKLVQRLRAAGHRGPLARALSAHAGTGGRHVHRPALEDDGGRRRVAAHRVGQHQQSLDGRGHRVRRRDRSRRQA